jgi:hypothetical protein
MESTFRLRASNIIQPSFQRAGVEDGFAWVLVGTTEQDIKRGWEEFLSWRAGKIAEALTLFDGAVGPDRLALLKASWSMLEEVGAQDDPSLIYYRAKMALDTELAHLAELESMRKRVHDALANGRLRTADRVLDLALRGGLEPSTFESLKYQIENQRARATSIVIAGDSLYCNGRYKETMRRYGEAERLNGDHPGLATKTANAEASHRQARAQTTMRTLSIVGGTVSRVLGEYFRSKREEASDERPDEGGDEAAEDTDHQGGESDRPADGRERVRVGDDSPEENEADEESQPSESEKKPEDEESGEAEDRDDRGDAEDLDEELIDESPEPEIQPTKPVRPVLMRIPSQEAPKSKPKKPPSQS